MALTSTQKAQALRKRRTALGQKELRGIWLTPEEETQLKPKIREWLELMRKSNEESKS